MEFNKTWVVITYLKTFTNEAKESRQSNESLSAKMEFHWTRIRLIKRIYHSICLQTKLSKTVDLFCIRIKDWLLRDETDWELIMWRSIDFLTGQRGLWIIEPKNAVQNQVPYKKRQFIRPCWCALGFWTAQKIWKSPKIISNGKKQ